MSRDDLKFFELAPAWAREMFVSLTAQVDKIGADIMAQVKVEQADLDNLQTTLNQVADDLESELAALNVPAGDLAGVQAALTGCAAT